MSRLFTVRLAVGEKVFFPYLTWGHVTVRMYGGLRDCLLVNTS